MAEKVSLFSFDDEKYSLFPKNQKEDEKNKISPSLLFIIYLFISIFLLVLSINYFVKIAAETITTINTNTKKPIAALPFSFLKYFSINNNAMIHILIILH